MCGHLPQYNRQNQFIIRRVCSFRSGNLNGNKIHVVNYVINILNTLGKWQIVKTRGFHSFILGDLPNHKFKDRGLLAINMVYF